MTKGSRTEQVMKNMLAGTLAQVISLLMSFVTRTVFIHTLNIEYLGVNGLFTNILIILSFAELGIGNAIVFSMYKPLAEGDQTKTKALIDLYGSAYRIIGLVIAVVGVGVIPFIDLVVKEAPNIPENLAVIYLLFLTNTVFSYFFAHKKAIITADQKNYIVIIYNLIFLFLQMIGQIVVLLTTHNFMLFLIIQIICTFGSNAVTANKANRMYPYIKGKSSVRISPQERQSIFANVRALFMYKMGSVVLNGTSNIIISAIIGIAAVGYCSNYLLVIGAVTSIIGQIMTAFTASIGNLNAIATTERKQAVFEQLQLVSVWVFGFASIGLILLCNVFIELWIGSDYLLSSYVLLAMVLHFYVNGVQFAPYTYRTTMGYFVQGRFAPVVAALINIGLSIWFAKLFGLPGVFLATSIARLLTMGWVDPYMVYKMGFSQSPIKYFLRYLLYAILVFLNFLATKYLLAFINLDGWMGFVIRAFGCIVLSNAIFAGMLWWTEEFKGIKQILKDLGRKAHESVLS